MHVASHSTWTRYARCCHVEVNRQISPDAVAFYEPLGHCLVSRLLFIWQLRTSLVWIGEWNRGFQAESDEAARGPIGKPLATTLARSSTILNQIATRYTRMRIGEDFSCQLARLSA